MRLTSLRRFTEPLVELLIRLSGWSAILFVFAIFFFTFREGAPFLFEHMDVREFFTSTSWRPDSEIRPQFGTLALIVGTLSVTSTVTAPAGTIEIDPSNNSATDADPTADGADLAINKH